jgi:hypothetical protein
MKSSEFIISTDNLDEGIGKAIGTGLLAGSALIGGVLGGKALFPNTDPAAQTVQSQTQKLSQASPAIKPPPVKKSNWESHTQRNEMDDTSFTYRSLSGNGAKLYLMDRTNGTFGIKLQLPGIADSHYAGSFPSVYVRVKIDGVLLSHSDNAEYKSFEGLLESGLNFISQIGGNADECQMIANKIANAKQSIKIEVEMYNKGPTVFTFAP